MTPPLEFGLVWMRQRRRLAWLIGLVVLVMAGAAVVVRVGPALSLTLALVLPRAEPWLASLRADVAVEEIVLEADGRHVLADLYRPAAPRGAVLLVHGLSRAGRRHPDLVRLARLLAGHRRMVVVPQFDGLAAFQLSGREVAEVRAALRALAGRGEHVAIAGFSFGAGPAVLAAADVPGVTLAASFGGYADLRDVIRYLTTGVHDFAGQRYVQPPEPYNRWKLLALLVDFVHDPRDRSQLATIAARKLADPGSDTGALEAALGPEGRAVRALVVNRREDAVADLLAALPREARTAIDALSPLGAAARLGGRLVIAHGARDVSIPFTQSLRLADASSRRARVVILETFEHATSGPIWPTLASRLRDGGRMVWLTDALLTER